MSELVVFAEQRVALAFGDYLRLLGLACRVEARQQEGGATGYALLLDDAAQLERAQAELRVFAADPQNPKYWRASWETGAAENVQLERGPRTRDVLRQRFQSTGPVTLGVMLLCVLVFFAELYDMDTVFAWLKFPAGLTAEAINNQWWRLLTPAVLHFSVMHIVFNLLWWWNLGGLLERTQSGLQLLGVSLLIALISNVAQFESYGSDFGGLSAVVYGLLGYMWLYPKANPAVGFQLRPALVWVMVIFMVLGYTGAMDVLAGGKVSNNGHAMGFGVGCVLGLAFGFANRGKPARAMPG
jgi:GlpG protein